MPASVGQPLHCLSDRVGEGGERCQRLGHPAPDSTRTHTYGSHETGRGKGVKRRDFSLNATGTWPQSGMGSHREPDRQLGNTRSSSALHEASFPGAGRGWSRDPISHRKRVSSCSYSPVISCQTLMTGGYPSTVTHGPVRHSLEAGPRAFPGRTKTSSTPSPPQPRLRPTHPGSAECSDREALAGC